MTTRLFSTVIDHTGNTPFQTWATELYNEIVAAGLVQTSDTGQLSTPVSAARPGTTTAAGYWIFRFDDTHQGTSPIFIKLEVGTGSSAAHPVIWVTVGTGSNGSGTITGTLFSRTQSVSQTPSAVTSYPTYICYVDGFFGLAWKSGGAPTGNVTGLSHLVIARSCDVDGDPSADGCVVYFGSSTGNGPVTSYSFGTAASVSTTTTHALIHYGLTDTTVGSDKQAFRHYGVFGQVRSINGVVTVVNAEVPIGTTVSVAVVGTTARTYINVGQAMRHAYGTGGTAGTHGVAFLWE